MTNYRSNIDDYDLLYVTETDLGLCVKRSEDDPKFWLPKSQVEYESKNYKKGNIVRVAMAEWLAQKHDLA